MKLIIGADICITDSNKEYFMNGKINRIIDIELAKILNNSDIKIFNLEGPLTDINSPITKCGPNLKMPEQSIKGLMELKPVLFTLANNHIMDQGIHGYQKTISLLDKAQISYFGAGDNIDMAQKPFILENDNLKIGIYACAEHEFTIAGKNSPGANPYDPLESMDHISQLKEKCDFVIVLYHGGKEYYRYPSPELQRVFRKMAQKGADLVVAQHTHCVGCAESYYGSTLIYGQGNFIFDYGDDEFWNSGLLIEINIEKNNYEIKYHSFVKENDGTISLEKKDEILNKFFERSNQILDEKFVYNKYIEYTKENFEKYLRVVHGNNFWFKVINKLCRGGFVFKTYKSRGAFTALLNYIECETHRELLITALKNHGIFHEVEE